MHPQRRTAQGVPRTAKALLNHSSASALRCPPCGMRGSQQPKSYLHPVSVTQRLLVQQASRLCKKSLRLIAAQLRRGQLPAMRCYEVLYLLCSCSGGRFRLCNNTGASQALALPFSGDPVTTCTSLSRVLREERLPPAVRIRRVGRRPLLWRLELRHRAAAAEYLLQIDTLMCGAQIVSGMNPPSASAMQCGTRGCTSARRTKGAASSASKM